MAKVRSQIRLDPEADGWDRRSGVNVTLSCLRDELKSLLLLKGVSVSGVAPLFTLYRVRV